MDVQISVRGGAHGSWGAAEPQGGLVIDLSDLRGFRPPPRRCATAHPTSCPSAFELVWTEFRNYQQGIGLGVIWNEIRIEWLAAEICPVVSVRARCSVGQSDDAEFDITTAPVDAVHRLPSNATNDQASTGHSPGVAAGTPGEEFGGDGAAVNDRAITGLSTWGARG